MVQSANHIFWLDIDMIKVNLIINNIWPDFTYLSVEHISLGAHFPWDTMGINQKIKVNLIIGTIIDDRSVIPF